MRHIKILAEVEEYKHFSELPADEQTLVTAAQNVARAAYAPYSGFFVGAALLLEDGTVVSGSNQENVAFPSGICAERTAMFWAGANYPGKAIVKMAIYAQSDDFLVETPVYPCGSCRQVMSEYERIGGQAIRILMVAATGKTHSVNGLINILPVAFDADNLKRQK
jgi:cytidine deaminase